MTTPGGIVTMHGTERNRGLGDHVAVFPDRVLQHEGKIDLEMPVADVPSFFSSLFLPALHCLA
jgi:hypothetical protein